MKTAPQIPLDLSPSLSSSFATFIVSACNVDAVTAVKTWPDWPSPILMLIGPKGSGKTHIGRAWAAETGGRFVDDADRCEEAELFAIMNEALNGTLDGLLLTARKAPGEWNIALPDLRSRLVNTPLTALKEHDDDILEPVLRRLFEEQGRAIVDALDNKVRTGINCLAKYASICQPSLADRNKVILSTLSYYEDEMRRK